MKLFRVLHLSDIHIGDTYMDSKDIAYRIISDIENENVGNIQCVIVTGDIFEGCYGLSDNIVLEAINFFNIIYEELKETTNIKKTDFLFVPGNHDVIRSDNIFERWQKYRTFLNKFYGTLPDFYDSNDFSLLKTYDSNRIAFAGFNSCELKKEPLIDAKLLKDINNIDNSIFDKFGINKQNLLDFINMQTVAKKYVDYGEIPPKQILKIKRELNKYDDYNIIAFFHHHFYLFPEVYTKYGDSSLIRNYTTVIQQMQQAGVKTVLHGHKHYDLERPLITDSYYENVNNIINIIAGGSVGTSRVSRHTFNIIDFYDKDNDLKIVQRKFTYNNDQLEPITIKQIPPKPSENNSSIKLYNILKINDPDLFSDYIEAIEKINIAADDYSNMIKWLESIFVGFDEIHKMFDDNSLCVFFLLFSMNYRILKIKQTLGKESIDSSYFNILDNLIYNTIPDVGFDKKQYLKIYEQSDLNILKEKCDEILGTLQNRKSKFYLSFSMISIFITDIYLMLRYYSQSFYNKYIKYKVNITLDENEFHQNIPVQKIMIHSDADRRSAFIDLRCNSATAHKLAVLFVKEFELIISKFEDYFKIVGLKLYYITPKIEKNNMSSAIDNYNFEAYIPTLIPLLTGDNIYARKEVFARELIQNSIDAIAVRASKESDFDKKIYITIGQVQGRKFFRIKDYGTGMDRFKIERYFTSIGRSFYSGDEYRDLELDYKPISNFGIGFLSAFMICREIDVKTRYYLDEKEGLKLHIPNFDGCFFIENEDNLDIGTEITLYIDKKISHDINPEKIIAYICNTMQDINYDIVIRDEINKEEILLESRNIRRCVDAKDILFIPFLESGDICNNINVRETIWSNDFIYKYPYGLLINIARWKDDMCFVLNSGIQLCDTEIDDIWAMLFKKDIRTWRPFNTFFSFNFPSNYLNIDVSREKITDFVDSTITPDFKIKLINEIYCQVQQYIELCKTNEIDNKAINIHSLMMTLSHLCKQDSSLYHLNKNIMKMRYILFVRFNSNSIDLLVGRQNNKPNNAIAYLQSNYTKCHDAFFDFISKNSTDGNWETLSRQAKNLHEIIPSIHELIRRNRLFDSKSFWIEKDFEKLYYNHMGNEKLFYDTTESLQRVLKWKDDNIVYVFLFLLAFVLNVEGEKSHISIMDNILNFLLENFTISQVEAGQCYVSIKYDDIKKLIKRLGE